MVSASPGRISSASRGGLIAAVALTLSLLTGDARAEIEIEIPDVTEAVESNIRGFLSLTRYADRKDITPDTMMRLERRIVTETREALEPLGYYEPEVEYRTTQDGDQWRVVINVRPGRPVRVSEVDINVIGAGRDLRALRELIEERELKPGLRLNHGTYEKVKSQLLRTARNEGFLDARLTRNEMLIDREERRATIAIELDTGERYHFGKIETVQDVVEEDVMRRLLRMEEGDPYTLDSLLRTQYVLDDTLYFSLVDIDSDEPDRETRTVPVTIRAEPNKRHRYAVSLGYGTDTRVRGKFTWDNRLVNREGHRFKTELTGSSVLKELSARYVIPIWDLALEKLEFGANASEEQLGDTLSERVEVGAGLTQVKGRWQRALFLRLSHETSTIPATPTTPETRDSQFLIIPGVSFATLPSYVIGTRTRPYTVYAELRGSPSTFGSEASFVQLRLQGERFFELSERWDLRVRGELGMSWLTGDFVDLPASQRFFAGGDRSVRGFGLNELPTDENGNRVGAENLFTASIEFERALPRNFGLAAFADVGNAFNSFSDPQLEYSAGLGLRWHIAVASLGVDVAQPLSVSGRNPRLHLYISTLF